MTYNLAPTASVNLYLTHDLPHGISGTYYIYAYIDEEQTICELNLDNNITRSATITVTLTPWPDFVVTNFEYPDATVAGNMVTLEYEVENRGTTAIENGAWTDNIYLTPKTFLDNSATLIYSIRKQGDLGINENYAEIVNVQIPSYFEAGQYYLIVFTDANNEYYEHLTEDNNIWISDSIFIEGYPLDLAAIDFSCSTDNIPWGETIGVNFTVQNISQEATMLSTWFDGIYLATDSSLTASTIDLKDHKHIGHLTPEQTYTVNTTCVIPNGIEGTYYLMVIVDRGKANFDINRENNFIAQKIAITPKPVPDLTV